MSSFEQQKRRRLRSWPLVLLLLLLGVVGCLATQNGQTGNESVKELNFANERLLHEHYLKHRAEFERGITEAQYLAKARAFFADRSPDKEGKSRPNGDELHYRTTTNEFGVLSRQKVIRTYFRPNNGRAYWERQ